MSRDYPSNKMTNHREHTCYFQKVGTKRETTGTIRAINSNIYYVKYIIIMINRKDISIYVYI
ncbi:hypothetical protein Hanom_Chr11g00998171 [Helianthus anomalus]